MLGGGGGVYELDLEVDIVSIYHPRCVLFFTTACPYCWRRGAIALK